MVLANGSIQAKKGEKSVEARQRDQNEEARAKLVAAKVDVSEADRFTSPGGLGHNKFFVRKDSAGELITVWTGSTNWTTTGLCTQLHNGLLIRDTAIASEYLEQWKRLRKAKSGFPAGLVDANTQAKPFDAPPADERNAFVPFDAPPPASTGSIWFTRTRGAVDTEALKAEIEAATVGILFLMFMPGGKAILPTMRAAAANPNLYVRGVVSQLPLKSKKQQPEAGDVVEIDVVKDEVTQRLTTEIIEPEGIKTPLSKWAVAELTRGQFKASVGQAIIHSKTMVIDPFTDHPVVITGSHNFSEPASMKNDENFIVIRDDPPLAEAYAVHIMAAYDHYRYRAVHQQNLGLSRSADWMAPKLESDSQELRVWNVRD